MNSFEMKMASFWCHKALEFASLNHGKGRSYKCIPTFQNCLDPSHWYLWLEIWAAFTKNVIFLNSWVCEHFFWISFLILQTEPFFLNIASISFWFFLSETSSEDMFLNIFYRPFLIYAFWTILNWSFWTGPNCFSLIILFQKGNPLVWSNLNLKLLLERGLNLGNMNACLEICQV